MNTETDKQRLITPVLAWFMAAMVLANTAGAMQGMLLPLYVSELGATITQVGLVFTLSNIVPLVLQVFGGWFSDNYGRLRAVAIGSIGGVLGHLILPFATSWVWVLVGLSVGSIARAMVGPSFSAFIAEQSSEQHRGRVYGITDTIFMVIQVIGPPLGGLLVSRYDFKLMLLVSAALYTAAAVLRVRMARTDGKTEKEDSQPLTWDSLRSSVATMLSMLVAGGLITWIFVTDGVRDIAFRMSDTLFPLYMEEISGITAAQIGWLGSVFGITMMAITIPSGWISDKLGERIPIIAGFLIDGFAVFMFTRLGGTFQAYATLFMLFGIGVGLQSPAYNSLVSKAVPDNMRGMAFGLFWTSLGIISLPAPYIGAALWERFDPAVPFTITAIMAIVSVLPVYFKFRLPKNENGENLPGDQSRDSTIQQ
ncbi:MAG: MFS transporter [Anaerolineales bacterium]|nr:MFS transporter [Anaerolineales bacterium]